MLLQKIKYTTLKEQLFSKGTKSLLISACFLHTLLTCICILYIYIYRKEWVKITNLQPTTCTAGGRTTAWNFKFESVIVTAEVACSQASVVAVLYR